MLELESDPFVVKQLGFKEFEGHPWSLVKHRVDGVWMVIALDFDDLLLPGNNIYAIQ